MTTAEEVYIGIDVGKEWLDMAMYADENVIQFANDEAGVEALLETLLELDPVSVVFEASGGYEQPAVQAMQIQGIPVSVANPTRVRRLADALGKLAKTDAIDAKNIAEYAKIVDTEPTEAKTPQELRLKALVKRREQLVTMRVAEQNRLRTVSPSIRSDIREHIQWMTERIAILEEHLAVLVRHLEAWTEQVRRLQTIPGVGFITAVSILALMPELGTLSHKEAAALAGLAPYNQDSGKKHGQRKIFGGRKAVRQVLYASILSSIQYNPRIRAFYERLVGRGKKKMVAMTACMRKLLTIMNAMTTHQQDWQNPV